MERFFAKIQNNKATISDADSYHLINVMRCKKGTNIEIVDEGNLFLGEVTYVTPLEIRIIEELRRPTELNVKLILGFSLLKGGHDELVLMKGTELGVTTFLPFISERTIIRLDGKERERRLERFKKIVSGAASQSKRLVEPAVLPIMDYKEALTYSATKRYLAYENVSNSFFNLPSELETLNNGESALFLIGPEDGFSPKEALDAKNHGFAFVSLGKRILRAETASIYLASVFSFIEEDK